MKAVPLRVEEEKARKTILNLRKGFIRKENLEDIKLLWLPVAIVKLEVVEKDKISGAKIVELINVYELIDGLWTGLSFSYPPEVEELEVEAVEKRVEIDKLIKLLEGLNVFKDHVKFAAFGISANASELRVVEVEEVLYPFYVGKLRGKVDRYVVISGVSGNIAGLRSETLKELYES